MNLKIDYQIYIPYYQTVDEMKKIYFFFKYVQDNYDQIRSYIRKYAKENLVPGKSIAAQWRAARDSGNTEWTPATGVSTGDKIVPLKEDVQADVYDSLSYLQALNEYLEDL